MSYTYDFSDCGPPDLGGYYWLDGERLSRAFNMGLPASVEDLLQVVMAVYAADRRSPRGFNGSRTGQREIQVKLAVTQPAWTDPGIYDRLIRLLGWLSEDMWEFEFVAGKARISSPQFLFRYPVESPVEVSLFSGGLDSLAGLAGRALDVSARSRVLVSGYTNNRLAHQQRLQVHGVRAAWRHFSLFPDGPCEIRHVAVPFGIQKLPAEAEEKSQRTRTLVFLAFGIVAAAQADSDTLWVYENGVGALNLPLNETQLGVDNYRGVHPISLEMAEDLFERVLGRRVRIRNPYSFLTKAQMCSALRRTGLTELVPQTVSCDGFAQRVPNKSQCGFCTSCILRRHSLHAAGLGRYDDGNRYRRDLLNDQTTLTLAQSYGAHAMLDQVHRLASCLRSSDPWGALLRLFPNLALVDRPSAFGDEPSSGQVRDQIIRMYQAYVREWETFPISLRLAA